MSLLLILHLNKWGTPVHLTFFFLDFVLKLNKHVKMLVKSKSKTFTQLTPFGISICFVEYIAVSEADAAYLSILPCLVRCNHYWYVILNFVSNLSVVRIIHCCFSSVSFSVFELWKKSLLSRKWFKIWVSQYLLLRNSLQTFCRIVAFHR